MNNFSKEHEHSPSFRQKTGSLLRGFAPVGVGMAVMGAGTAVAMNWEVLRATFPSLPTPNATLTPDLRAKLDKIKAQSAEETAKKLAEIERNVSDFEEGLTNTAMPDASPIPQHPRELKPTVLTGENPQIIFTPDMLPTATPNPNDLISPHVDMPPR